MYENQFYFLLLNRKGAKSYGLAPFLVIRVPIIILLGWIELNSVGASGFEPPISGPPDQHFNRTKLHPEFAS